MKNKANIPGNVVMLVLKLLEEGDMYGWQIIEELALKSYDVFQMKTGALYPILHDMEKGGLVIPYKEIIHNGRVRKYYRITDSGKQELTKKKLEWESYIKAVNHVLEGGGNYAIRSENC
jgi:PadR family transcriptional regulator PadR